MRVFVPVVMMPVVATVRVMPVIRFAFFIMVMRCVLVIHTTEELLLRE
jgi:hypothetical protein